MWRSRPCNSPGAGHSPCFIERHGVLGKECYSRITDVATEAPEARRLLDLTANGRAGSKPRDRHGPVLQPQRPGTWKPLLLGGALLEPSPTGMLGFFSPAPAQPTEAGRGHPREPPPGRGGRPDGSRGRCGARQLLALLPDRRPQGRRTDGRTDILCGCAHLLRPGEPGRDRVISGLYPSPPGFLAYSCFAVTDLQVTLPAPGTRDPTPVPALQAPSLQGQRRGSPEALAV